MGVADGCMYVDGVETYSANDLRVGFIPETVKTFLIINNILFRVIC